MKRAARTAGLVLLVLLLGFVAFFFWASSGTLSEDELATTTTYAAEPTSPRDTLTVMTYNIGYLSGMTNNEPVERSRSLYDDNMDAATDVLRGSDPDIIGFQEIDFGAARSFDVHQLDTLATRLGYAASATAVNWDERYLPYPYHWNPKFHFGRVLSGQAVLSRYPMLDHERIELARTSRPFWTDAFYIDRLAQVVHLDVDGDTLTVINVHLEAFETATREEQAREVRDLAARFADRPLLLIGDINSVPPGALDALPSEDRTAFADDETFRALLDDLPLQAALPDSAYDAPIAEIGTFPADGPTRPIDHIFYTPDHIEALSASVLETPDPPSDHRPVVMQFVLR